MPRRYPWAYILLIGLGFAFIPLITRLGSLEQANEEYTVASSFHRFLRRANLFTKQIPSASVRSHSATPEGDPLPVNATGDMGRTPVYFFSHGGPNVMEETQHPAYATLQAIGREITGKVKPKAAVVFSAHWQGDRNAVEVNTAESMGLIYDFYGFPAHYYSMKYPNRGSPELATQLIEKFKTAGIKAEGVRRGLDHGIWAGFMVAFDPVKNPLNVPVLQVSLFDTEDPDQHYALGRAISSLRDEGIVVICSGMSVHNLRDMWRAMQVPTPMPYTVTFDEALKEAVEQPPETRQRAMKELLKRPDARKAHPTFDHLLPIHIAAGAAGGDVGKQIWTFADGSMAWAQYRFGEIDPQ